jgi:hypothetical protein
MCHLMSFVVNVALLGMKLRSPVVWRDFGVLVNSELTEKMSSTA